MLVCSEVLYYVGSVDQLSACAYPYGNTDAVVQHVIGGCGYQFGLSCQPGFSKFDNNLLELPRIEVYGSDSLAQFVAKLNPA